MDTFRIYRNVIEPGTTDDGAILEWHKGCNGKQHVDLLDKIFYEADGKTVKFAEIVAQIERGVCDKTCCKCNLGSFQYTSRNQSPPDPQAS